MSDEVMTYALGRRRALDGLRGLAVLFVVVGHSVGTENSAGTVGVTLFFTLSGFLITRILIERHARAGVVGYRAFLVRRARRLVPALLLFLIAAAIICVRNNYPIIWAILPAVYATNLAMAAGEPVQLTGHTWSLGLEEQFYILWPPLLAFTLRRRGRPVLIIAGLLALVTLWRCLAVRLGWSYLRVAFGPDMRVDAILMGCLLAFLADHLWRLPSSAAVGSGAGLLALCPIVRLETEPGLMPLASICATVVVAVAASRTPRALSFRPLCLLGTISYGVYLWHVPIVMEHPRGWTALPTALVVSVGIATLSWRCVESRFLTQAPTARAVGTESMPLRGAEDGTSQQPGAALA